jgi:hypothetical protein
VSMFLRQSVHLLAVLAQSPPAAMLALRATVGQRRQSFTTPPA